MPSVPVQVDELSAVHRDHVGEVQRLPVDAVWELVALVLADVRRVRNLLPLEAATIPIEGGRL